MEKNNFSNVLNDFLINIDAIQEILPMTQVLLSPHVSDSITKLKKFAKVNTKKHKGEEGTFVKDGKFQILKQLDKDANISILSFDIISESLFVSLISKYDAFLNNLLKIIYDIEPKIMNSSDKQLSFSTLSEMTSLIDIKNYFIENEIESVLRKSHSEHFDYLEKILNIELRKNLPIWGKFIEITERRNLIVHNNGIVSKQYLSVCRKNKCLDINIKHGDTLNISIEYFIDSYKVLYEIAVKLTNTIWRKISKKDLKNADGYLNDICFNLLQNKHYHLAYIISEFACKQKTFFNKEYENVFIINMALSKYLQDKKEESIAIIDKYDWSCSSDDFKLAISVIKENYTKSYNLMKKIGKDGDMNINAYKERPLFTKIKNEKKFKDTYKDIFSEKL